VGSPDALVEERVREALGRGVALRIRGGGTKDWYGGPLRGEPLEVAVHAGIVDYDPSELVVTARCGTPLADLERTLAGEGQMLAFEPPHFGREATVGGCVATGLSGPRRACAGSVRDFVLGARLIDGQGQHLAFGGRVIKNVAGYDVSRLLAGSLGVLGVITEVSLKVVPQPADTCTLRLEVDQGEALRLMNEWAGRPLPLSATVWHEGVLRVRLAGAVAAVAVARRAIGGEVEQPADAEGLWSSLREQSHPFFNAPSALWRLSVPQTAPVIDLPGPLLVEWGGAQRWIAADLDAAQARAAAAAVGGHATRFRDPLRRPDVFTPLPPAVADIHRRLKAVFDPRGLFNPGRLQPDL
jgi:glycolate oxidase FAD binding subunit